MVAETWALQVAAHESAVRTLGQTKKADNLAAHVKLGRAACELAPAQIFKLDIAGLIARISQLDTAQVPLPSSIWLHLLAKVACSHLEREAIPEFVRCVLPWKTSGVADKLSAASPALSLIDFPEDTPASVISHFISETIFSDELARLLKQPTTSVVVHLADQIIMHFDIANEKPEIVEGVPEFMIEPFDEVFEAMKALRAVGFPEPTVGGRKAARDIFSPEMTPSLSDNLKALVTSCRASNLWCSQIDNFWPTSGKSDAIAEDFAHLRAKVCSPDATLDTMAECSKQALHVFMYATWHGLPLPSKLPFELSIDT
jgi:hypothetical protein